jgi:hypothetical protein
MRWILVSAAVLAACSPTKPEPGKEPAQPINRTITAAGLDSLPPVALRDGRLVCLADGVSTCPTGTVTANWLAGGSFATWEQHKVVEVWHPGATDPSTLGEVGNADNQYDAVLSVAATPTGYTIISLSGQHVLSYDATGVYRSSLPVPPIRLSRTAGYSGSVAFSQLIHEAGHDSVAVFEVRLIDGPGDTIGKTVLSTRLNWFKLHGDRTTAPLPLFPTLPSYAFAADSDIIWSPGDVMSVERQSPSGALRWSLKSEATGSPILPADLKATRERIPADDRGRLASFDSSAAHTGKFYPAVGGLLLARDGRVLVSGPQVPGRDSVAYYVLGNTGQPVGRFGMPARTRALLFDGDSLLVQRSGANTNLELRWLVLGKQ